MFQGTILELFFFAKIKANLNVQGIESYLIPEKINTQNIWNKTDRNEGKNRQFNNNSWRLQYNTFKIAEQ